MRAKTINFERGLDPKDALEIGDKEAREFRKALRYEDYFYPVLKNMINGLKKKTVNEKEAINFVNGGINEFNIWRNKKYKNSLGPDWYQWYKETRNNAYWNTDHDKFIITIQMPDNEKLNMDQDRKIICEISPTFSQINGEIFRIRSYAHIKNNFENFYEDHFEKENVFLQHDESFTLLWACKMINSVVETVIKELG
jgi:hypothetical protein